MMRFAVALLLLASLAGCSSNKADSSASLAKTSGAQAVTASQPQALTISNQTLVYECPKCGADYDKPGTCPTDQTKLVATSVAYICPADNKPVEHTGKCPRCNADATVQKTAIAANSQ